MARHISYSCDACKKALEGDELVQGMPKHGVGLATQAPPGSSTVERNYHLCAGCFAKVVSLLDPLEIEDDEIEEDDAAAELARSERRQI